MKQPLARKLMLASSVLAAVTAAPVVAQQGQALLLEEVVVTARRREERLQDVPISMTVFSQEQMDRNNIFNMSDLGTYTPSLEVNTRFGADSTTFAIRGFSQELRTTASVGVYFAEVVAPRGGNVSQSGDGAGPGDLFDLESVQVLKGPQGTLFGRNTTGGAILLSPKKPTDQFEGYAEVSAGNYDMWRGQAVVNVPVSDAVRLRFGVDHQQRDGYLNNISGIGPDDFANVDYTAFRASAVIDIADNLENYTIFKMSESDNNGYPGSLLDCNAAAGGLGGLCMADLQQRIASGNNGFYDLYNFIADPINEIEQWQVINTTTWEVNDNLTVKGIISYADFENNQRNAINGTNWQLPTGGGMRPIVFAMAGVAEDLRSADQETLVAELQFQGTAFEDRLVWQAGVYHEKSEPGSDYGPQSPAFIACDLNSVKSGNPLDWRCNNLLGIGSVQRQEGGVTYKNQAVYAQGTYELTSTLSLTAGIRYTDDETDGYVDETIALFPTDFVTGAYLPPMDFIHLNRTPSTKSEEPTWLLGLDYKPSDDLLVYGKYARGYRQGSVNLAGVPGLETHGPEKVDTYEVGVKTSFDGVVAGNFNVALFYNDFQDQQVQYGYFTPYGTGTTAVLNAGESTIQGLEIESTLHLTDRLTLTGSYTYLDTEVKELVMPPLPPGTPVQAAGLNSSTAAEEPLSFSPENKLVLALNYALPVDATLGDMTAGITYTYTDDRQAVSRASSALAVLPSYDLVNLNFNWDRIGGSPVDMSMFVTNVTDEEYVTFLSGNWNNGFELGRVGQPRMYGMRLKYNF